VNEPYKQPIAAAVLLCGRLHQAHCVGTWYYNRDAMMHDWYTGYLGTNGLGTNGDIQLVSWVPILVKTALVNLQPSTRNWYPLYTNIGYPICAKARGARICDSA